jgi:hypothetical protein
MPKHFNWIAHLLPQLDERPLHQHLDLDQSVYAEANDAVRTTAPAGIACPSADTPLGGHSYAGCIGGVATPIDGNNGGVLFRDSAVALRDVTDGAHHTLLIGEGGAEGLSWASGTAATLAHAGVPPNVVAGPAAAEPEGEADSADPASVGGFHSAHRGGVQAALCDGGVRLFDESIDATVWSRLGERADGELLPPGF